jgi:hypothetical protein
VTLRKVTGRVTSLILFYACGLQATLTAVLLLLYGRDLTPLWQGIFGASVAPVAFTAFCAAADLRTAKLGDCPHCGRTLNQDDKDIRPIGQDKSGKTVFACVGCCGED